MAKKKLDAKVSKGVMIRIRCPEWYRDKRFLHWLNEGSMRNGSVATWHRNGRPDTEYSDVFVGVEPALNGEGTDDNMPFWDDMMTLVKQQTKPSKALSDHIVVWISGGEDL